MTSYEHMAEAERFLMAATPGNTATVEVDTVLCLAAIAHALIGAAGLSTSPGGTPMAPPWEPRW